MRIEGPLVHEVESIYAELWNFSRAQGDPGAETVEEFEPAPVAAPAGTSLAQIQLTSPVPEIEQSILAGQRKAILQARDYILVEDQYWRGIRLLDAFAEALTENPALRLIVVTNEIKDNDGGKKWTIEMHETLKAIAPDRYAIYQLRAFDTQTRAEAADGRSRVHVIPFLIHSKLMIIDDRYLTVGSANKNNRSLLYDGEMNVAVLDEALATDARRTILSEYVGPLREGLLDASTEDIFDALASVADENQQIVERWEDGFGLRTDAQILEDRHISPFGFLFPYAPTGRFLLDVGPDFY